MTGINQENSTITCALLDPPFHRVTLSNLLSSCEVRISIGQRVLPSPAISSSFFGMMFLYLRLLLKNNFWPRNQLRPFGDM